MKVPVSLESVLDLRANSVSVDKQLSSASLIGTAADGQQRVTGMNSTVWSYALI